MNPGMSKMQENDSLPPRIFIILDHLRSAHNTGNIFRIAEAVSAEEVLCCGYTPCPPHPKLVKTAMGTDLTVKSQAFVSASDAILSLRKEIPQITIIGVEPVINAIDAFDFFYTSPIAFVFGNEAIGISPDALSLCDYIIALPMLGKKASINVGNCVATVLYIANSFLRRKKR